MESVCYRNSKFLWETGAKPSIYKSFQIENVHFEAVNVSKHFARNELLRKSFGAYCFNEKKKMFHKVNKYFISLILSVNDPFEERVQFLCQGLLPFWKDLKSCLKSASEIFSEKEKLFLIDIDNMICVKNTKPRVTRVELTINGVHLCKEGPTEAKAKSDLIIAVLNLLPKHPECLEINFHGENSEEPNDFQEKETFLSEKSDDDPEPQETGGHDIALTAVKNRAFGNVCPSLRKTLKTTRFSPLQNSFKRKLGGTPLSNPFPAFSGISL